MSHSGPADTRSTLLSYLNAQRAHVLGILDGVTETDLRRPILSSGWSCVGLVQHLALDVERFWFEAVMAGEQAAIDELDAIGNAWQVAADVPAGVILDLYREEIEGANAVITATPLEAAP